MGTRSASPTIAASFGIGAALHKSGAAAAVAGVLFDATQAMGPVAALAMLYFIASVVMEVLTNNAAAVLMFPICVATGEQFDNADPRPPGGYRFGDFFRVGALLNLILGIVAIVLIPIFWPFH
jgi:di/tricarboxylate transporter